MNSWSLLAVLDYNTGLQSLKQSFRRSPPSLFKKVIPKFKVLVVNSMVLQDITLLPVLPEGIPSQQPGPDLSQNPCREISYSYGVLLSLGGISAHIHTTRAKQGRATLAIPLLVGWGPDVRFLYPVDFIVLISCSVCWYRVIQSNWFYQPCRILFELSSDRDLTGFHLFGSKMEFCL